MHAGAAEDQQGEQQASALAAATPPGTASSEGSKKKRAKLKHAPADELQQSGHAGGISLFGGQPAPAQGQQDDPAAALADTAPRVSTGDPYEEANLLRKAHRIKARGVRLAWCAVVTKGTTAQFHVAPLLSGSRVLPHDHNHKLASPPCAGVGHRAAGAAAQLCGAGAAAWLHQAPPQVRGPLCIPCSPTTRAGLTCFPFPSRARSNLVSSGFTEPTPIQRQAATALLAGRELLAIAPTGSGKTLSFLLPLVMRVRALKQQEAAAVDEGDAAGSEAAGGIKAVVVRWV